MSYDSNKLPKNEQAKGEKFVKLLVFVDKKLIVYSQMLDHEVILFVDGAMRSSFKECAKEWVDIVDEYSFLSNVLVFAILRVVMVWNVDILSYFDALHNQVYKSNFIINSYSLKLA